MVFCSANSEDLNLFPADTELIYSWHADLITGTAIPQSMNSKWDFNATLIIQHKTDNFTTFKITDIKTSESKLETQPVSLPFQASYQNGLLVKLYTDENDKKWSVNIKRALVTLIQLNLANINQPAFTNDESGLYGTCKNQYIITRDNGVKVHKIVDMQSCLNFKQLKWNSAPSFKCSNNYQKEMSHSEREYTLDLDGKTLIKDIKSKGEILLQPYQSQAEAHYSLVRQSLNLVDVKPIKDQIIVNIGKNEKPETNLIWEPLNLDPTYGKPPTNKTAVLNEIQDMLGETSDSLSSWEVGVTGLNNETLFRLVDLMWWLDVEDWETLYNSVTLGTSYRQETIQQIFWELVPEVGSSASALFIKDLVRTGRVKGYHAARLLINLPFKLRYPTEELLTQCEEFLRLGDVGEEVKHSAILSFATMIHKTCSKHCKADTLDRYTKLYLDRFKESTLHVHRMLYLQGLCNIELPHILEYLTPVVLGQDTKDKHIRFLAIWAVLNSAYTNPNKVYELFWPLLINRTESLEIRVASLTMLILSKPTPAGLISLFWFMQSEPSQQLYQFYFTTIQSLTQTTYPCYAHLRVVASQLARFVHPRSNNWATGNYILDYEEQDRGYGGLLQMLMVGSERTGLPNVMIAMAEQHALGISTEYTLYLKIEGLGEAVRHLFENKTEKFNIAKVFEELQKINVPIKRSEPVHLEFIFKIDSRTIISYYLNETNFHNLTSVARRLSSLYFEFSVNYQRLTFPMALIKQQATDFGVTALSQVRTTSFVSARGRVSQDEDGAARNAELDLRFTWHGVTSLRLFSPLSNTWYGADRSRSLHIRLPFATNIIVNYLEQFIKITAVRHRDFAAGSRLGGVWHTMTRIVAGKFRKDIPHNITDEWTMDSEDLGARLGASVFDCPGNSNLRDSLHLLKRAFLAKNKNYQMVPGGVALLGIFSLKEQLAFQPPGGSCGVMLSFVPLLNQAEPVLLLKRNQLSLSLKRLDGLLWDIQAGIKKLHDGNREVAFKLYHYPSISVTTGGFWRVIQFEGVFIIPSRKSGVFHPPAPLTGYVFVSWGDALPSNSDKAAVVDLKVMPGNNESHNSLCVDFKPACLQTFTDLATRQTVTVQHANLPGWLKTAAHALFPEHFQTESTSTEFAFNSPVPFPWNSKGLCAISADTVLSLDNATLNSVLSPHYTIAVADCSVSSQFTILVRKLPGFSMLGAKILSGTDEVELFPASTPESFEVKLNGRTLPESEFNTDAIFNNDTSSHIIILKKDSGMIEVELKNGVVFQHYSSTAVFLIPGAFRGFTCGLCGDYNSDTNNDQPLQNYCIKNTTN